MPGQQYHQHQNAGAQLKTVPITKRMIMKGLIFITVIKIICFLRPKDGVYKLDGLINPATKRSIGAAVQVFCTFDNNGKGESTHFNAHPLYMT